MDSMRDDVWMEPSRRTSLRKKWLSHFNREEGGGEEGGSTAGIAVAEGLGTRVEPSLGRITVLKSPTRKPTPPRFVGHRTSVARSR